MHARQHVSALIFPDQSDTDLSKAAKTEVCCPHFVCLSLVCLSHCFFLPVKTRKIRFLTNSVKIIWFVKNANTLTNLITCIIELNCLIYLKQTGATDEISV